MGVGYNPKIVTTDIAFCYDEVNAKTGNTKEVLSGATNTYTSASEISFAPNELTNKMWSTGAGKDFTSTGAGFTLNVWTKRTAITTGDWNPVCVLEWNQRCMWFGYFFNTTDRFHCSFPYYNASNVLTYWDINPYFSDAGITHQIGRWYNICLTYNNSSRLLSVYFDTTLALTGTRPGTGDLVKPYNTTENPIRIFGTRGDTTYNHSTGYTAMYNRALTLTEVKQNFNALRGRFGL